MRSCTAEVEFVEEANLHYYQAVAAQSLPDLDDIWLPSEACRCLLPGWPLLYGWSSIRRGWQALFDCTRELSVSVDRVTVQIEGDRAWLNCRERMQRVVDIHCRQNWLRVANLFWKRQGRWRLVLHHAAPLAASPGRWLQ